MDRTERDLAGLDAERPLPPEVRARLEGALLDDAAGLLAGLDAPRPLPPSTRTALENTLVAERYRRPWRLATAVAAAVVLLTASAAVLTRVSGGDAGAPTERVAAPAPTSTPSTEAPLQAAAAATAPSTTVTAPRGVVSAVHVRPQIVVRPTTTMTTAPPCTAPGTCPAAATALDPPYVTSVDPAGGPASGGTRVTVHGAGFTGATGVLFGSESADSFTVVSDSEVVAVSPPSPGPQTVAVSVVFHDGSTSTAEADDHFTYSS